MMHAEYLESLGWSFEGVMPRADHGGLLFLAIAPGYGKQWVTEDEIVEFAEIEAEEQAARASRRDG